MSKYGTRKYGTHFSESEVILAAGEADEEMVDHILHDMNNGELKRLGDAADFVSGRIDEILQERREKSTTPPPPDLGLPETRGGLGPLTK